MKKITSFAKALRNARKEVYTNGEDMAYEIGWSEKTYRQYEKDDATLPPPDVALLICQVLNKPSLFINYLHQLFTEQDYYPLDLNWFSPGADEIQDLRREVLTTIKEIRDVVNLEHTIIDISLDGEVTDKESQKTSDYLQEVNELIQALIQLKIHLEEELNRCEER